MFRAVRLCPAIVLCVLCVLPAAAQQPEEDGIDVQRVHDGIEECLNPETPQSRIDCYSGLCEPGYRCAEALLRAATDTMGPVMAFTVLDDVMTDHHRYGITTDAHELAHVIGRQLAKRYGTSGDAFLRCTDAYYYGCQHGFFEIILAQADDPVQAAADTCESAPENQRFFCYHGVGHGFMQTYAYDLDGVLEKCNQMPEGAFRSQGCWQGAFMENVNSFLRGEDKPGVYVRNDPLQPCKRLAIEYQWECYYNHASYLLRIHNHDVGKAVKECLAADPQSRAACTRGLGQLAGTPGWQSVILGERYDESKLVESSIALCDQFPKEEYDNCITGIIEDSLNYNREPQALRLCSLLAENAGQRTSCYRSMGIAMQRSTYDPAKFRTFCAQFPDDYRTLCDPSGTLLKAPEAPNIVVQILHGIWQFFVNVWHFFQGLFAVAPSVSPTQGLVDSPPVTRSGDLP